MVKKVTKAQLIAVRDVIAEPAPPRVAILGGSFDPPHLGHSCLALSILSVADVDEVWVLPCSDHPQSKALSAFHHRMDMCQLAFRHLRPQVRVLKVEKHLPAPNFTAQTLQALQSNFPTTQFQWIIGSDLLNDLPNWEDAQWLARHVRFLMVEREGFPMDAPPKGFQITCFSGLTLPNIASRKLRNAPHLTQPPGGMDKAVWAYALEKGLYDEGA